MYIGFDYGTANCSVAVMKDDQPTLVQLEGEQTYIASTICAPTRESITESLFRHHNIKPSDAVGEQLLRAAIRFNDEEGIDVTPSDILFGDAALKQYLSDPDDHYFVKSPKSFLGATGLKAPQIRFFEDLVCAMMVNIKNRAETQLAQSIESAVIGRPVNFQGTGGDKANQQAIAILDAAATRAGFKQVSYQFEPVAAGVDFEATLTKDKLVLVVDIGGGTTDCSLLKMGPERAKKSDRSDDLIAHSGCRVGGNDLDINVAFQQITPYFGRGSELFSGRAMPLTQFWNPVAINSVTAQGDFYAASNRMALRDLHKEAKQPQQLARLLEVYQNRLGHQLVRGAELMKIALSSADNAIEHIVLRDEKLMIECNRSDFAQAIESTCLKISQLIDEVLLQSETKPDVVYVTGGSARSPMLRALIEQQLPGIEMVTGDYFGSVTAGLARTAQHHFG
ncbi:molecular chaperone [Vibrio pacinii]|uniref:molecular chaperone n=1 Tax=Vibrio pacinii TaxID=170674 RepID=UPI00056DABA0|nr:molecular chaperone [Vibrio pacinii]